MMINNAAISIHVKDLDKSILFYESISLTLKNRWGNYYAQMTAPGITIGLHPITDANLTGNSGNTSIGFTVDNFEETANLLQKLAIKSVDRQEEGGRFLHFSDSDGTALYFINPKW